MAGYRQSPEHVRKRLEKIAQAKAAWSPERREAFSALMRLINPMRNPVSRQRVSAAKKGQPPWHKGQNWKAHVTTQELRTLRAGWARLRRRSARAKLCASISAQIRFALKGHKHGRRWEHLVGYSAAGLEAHLKTTLPTGYSWNDYVAGRLEVDHVVPISAHNFTTADDIDFYRCWSLGNLRLLPAAENLRKGGKLLNPFQPALAFSKAS